MTAARARGTLELAKVARRRRRRPPSVSQRTAVPYLLEKLLAELRHAPHDCRSCGWEMAERTPGFWWCENCAELGTSRRRRSYVGSSIGRSS